MEWLIEMMICQIADIFYEPYIAYIFYKLPLWKNHLTTDY